jgi:hypothetical protein
MPSISSLKTSSKTFCKMSSSVLPQQHSFLFQFVMSMAIVILFLGYCPSVSSSPTPSSPTLMDHNNKINYESNGFMFDPSDFQATSAGDSSLLSPTVQHSLSGSSPFWYAQPRTHANQFLMSHVNDNDVIVPKWFTRYNNDDQTNDIDDLDDYVPAAMFFNSKRSTSGNGAFSNLKKRKQLTKPPMEVMNEIVNSIYLKR